MFNVFIRLAAKKIVLTTIVLLAAIGVYWYQRSQKNEPTRYIVTHPTRGTLLLTVSGTGQVSGENQITIKPTVAGAVKKIFVKPGDAVKKDAIIMQIDDKIATKNLRDTAQAVADARVSVDSSALSLKKLKQPPDPVALLQAENTLNQAKRNLAKLQEGPDPYDIAQQEAELASQRENIKISTDGKTPNVIRNGYDNAVPLLKSTSQTLQSSLYDADAILGIENAGANDAYERLLSVLDSSKIQQAVAVYPFIKATVASFKQTADALKSTNEDTARIDAALVDADRAMNAMAPFLQHVYDALLNTVTSPAFPQATLSSLQSGILTNRSNVAAKTTSLVTQTQAILTAKASYTTSLLQVDKSQAVLDKIKRGTDPKEIASAQEKVAEAETSLAKIRRGADPIDISLAENALAERRSSLASAQHKLADAEEALRSYAIKAPFDGLIANIQTQEHDQISSGAPVTTLLTQAKIAQLSLNEVDAAKVRSGQKATLVFDAIPELQIAGTVSEVDAIGTVAQGVVNYAIKIFFETQDNRVKTGMSVSAAIVTDLRPDALMVPNAAVRKNGENISALIIKDPKTDVGANKQEATSDVPPETRSIRVGISNEQMTEITSGLSEQDAIITRTLDATTAAKTVQTGGSIRIPGLGGGFGGGGAKVGR